MTLVHGHLTPVEDGLAVELVRAGHTLPLLLDAGHTVTPVEAHGGLKGIGIPPRLDAVRFTLRPTESLVLYTDGITECRAAGTEQYGDARLLKALASTPARPTATDIVRRLTEDIRAFTNGRTVDDDQAALVVTAGSRRRAGGEAGPLPGPHRPAGQVPSRRSRCSPAALRLSATTSSNARPPGAGSR